MLRSKWIVGLGAVVLGGALAVAQQQSTSAAGQSSSTSSQQQTTPRRNSNRLTRPWSQLTDLGDDVKTKIISIHRKSLDDIAAIRAKEREDIMALLTEAQKKQVVEIDAQGRGGRRSTTRPAAGN